MAYKASGQGSASQILITNGCNTRYESTSRDAFKLSLRRTSVVANLECWRSALSWRKSKSFGKSTCPFVPYAVSDAETGTREANFPETAFTKEQSKLVNESWKLILKREPGKVALDFFLKVFEIAPAAKRLFSFLKDSEVPIEKNPKLKTHALQVLLLTGECAVQLGHKGAVDAMHPKLLELGQTHAIYGVVDEHFDVVKFALLLTLEGALPDVWNVEMKNAWSQAYDELVHVIKEEMIALRDRRTVTLTS